VGAWRRVYETGERERERENVLDDHDLEHF